MGARTSLDKKRRVVNLHEWGCSNREIGRQLNLDRATVAKVLKEYEAHGKKFLEELDAEKRRLQRKGWNSYGLSIRSLERCSQNVTTYKMSQEEIRERYGRPGLLTDDDALRSSNKIFREV